MRDEDLNTLLDLRDHFLNKEGGSLEMLDDNFAEAIKSSEGWKNHAIFLYHATKNAVVRQDYGSDTESAADVLRKHLRSWVNKALSFKTPPEPWVIPQTLTAFHMLRVRPPAKYVEYCQKSVQRSLSRWNKEHMLSWIGSASDLAIDHDPTFIQAACRRMVVLAPNMNCSELHDLARHMAIMDAVAEARNPARPKHMGKAFQQIFSNPQVRQELKSAASKEESYKLVDALYWFSRQKASFPRGGTEDNSGLQSLVARQFKAAGAHLTRSRRIADTGHELDLSFNFNGCNFDVEVDGPKHFIRCTDGHIITLDGSSIFQTLLIKEKDRDRSVVRLPYTVYDDHADMPEMWKGLCGQITAAGPGAYMVDSYGKLTPDLLTRCRAYPVYAKG